MCLCLIPHDHIKLARLIEYLYVSAYTYNIRLVIESECEIKREIIIFKCTCNGSYKFNWNRRMICKFIFLLCD